MLCVLRQDIHYCHFLGNTHQLQRTLDNKIPSQPSHTFSPSAGSLVSWPHPPKLPASERRPTLQGSIWSLSWLYLLLLSDQVPIVHEPLPEFSRQLHLDILVGRHLALSSGYSNTRHTTVENIASYIPTHAFPHEKDCGYEANLNNEYIILKATVKPVYSGRPWDPKHWLL